MKKAILLFAAFIGLILIMSSAVLAVDSQKKEVVVLNACAEPGQTVTVSGSSCCPGETVNFCDKDGKCIPMTPEECAAKVGSDNLEARVQSCKVQKDCKPAVQCETVVKEAVSTETVAQKDTPTTVEN